MNSNKFLLLINFYLMQRYSGSDLHGITAKVVDMPHHCMDFSMVTYHEISLFISYKNK